MIKIWFQNVGKESMPEISVCIPTYEFKGKGVKYLDDIFDGLRKQTFQDFDIVVSDTKEFYIIDVNKTPCWGETQNNDLPIMRFLASCLET